MSIFAHLDALKNVEIVYEDSIKAVDVWHPFWRWTFVLVTDIQPRLADVPNVIWGTSVSLVEYERGSAKWYSIAK